MKKQNIFTVLLLTIPLFFMFSGFCFGAELNTYKNDFIQKIHQGYIDSAMAYASIFVDYATNLFWWLVLLDLLFHIVMFYKKNDADLDEFMGMLFFRILYAGFFLLILEKGADLAAFIYETIVNDFATQMINAGITASGGAIAGPAQVSPSDFLDIGFSICFAITEKAGFWSTTGLMTNLVAIILIILFMLIVAEIVVAMVEFYLVASIGYFLLAFGGLTQTQSIVWSYFKTLFAMSFKIMAVYAVTSISFGFIREVAGTATQQEAIVGDTESLLVLLAGTCLFAILARTVPERLTSVITGAIFNGNVNAGASSMVRNILSAGAGAAAGAAIASGGSGAAVSSAVQLAKAQGNSGGGPTTGSGGVQNGKPQSFSGLAGRTMMNLGRAATDTVMSKGAKGENTFANFGGTMANRMDNSKEKMSAASAVSNAGDYKAPTAEDVKNTLKSKK